MARLQKAPVVYVLGVVRFPQLVDIDQLAAALHPRLRDDYPHAQQITAPHVSIEIGDDGLHVRNEEIRIWQFSSLDRKWAVILNAGMIGLHTVDYTERMDFFARFGAAVQAASEVPDAGIRFVEALALRYVDLVEPAPGDGVADYVVPTVLPSEVPGIEGLGIQDGVFAARYVTGLGNMRLQVLRRPPSVFPPELNTPVTHANEWGLVRPEGDFAVIDTDHGMSFNPPAPLDVTELKDNMLKLHGPIRSIFDKVVTGHAMSVWKGEA